MASATQKVTRKKTTRNHRRTKVVKRGSGKTKKRK